MKHNIIKLIKNSIAIFFSKLSPRILSFLFIIYIARFLGVTGFGKFVIALGYFELFLGITSTGLRIILTREIAKVPKNASQYMGISIILGFVVSLIACLILILFASVTSFLHETQNALILVSIALLPGTTAIVFEAGFVGIEKAEYVTYGTLLENGIRTIIWFLALLLGYKLIVLIIILIITRCIMLFFYVYNYVRKISKLHFDIQKKQFKFFISDWRTIAFENWLSSFIWNLDFIFLSTLKGEKIVGLYMAGYKILNFADIGTSSYILAVFPYMTRLYRESKIEFKKLIERSIKYALIFIILLSSVLFLLNDKIILFIYGVEYVYSVPIFSVLIWVIIFKFMNPFLSHVLFARGEQIKSLQIAIISLIIYLPISFWFIHQWEGIGAALALLIVAIFSCYLFVIYIWRDYQILKFFARTHN
jgi:O-antigen/teichoic acid export membrane protein